jgi:pimeloyl-ACP methyl ester carboxylesterase
VDVGGYQLHINCVGAGSPTVVLESAFPGTSADWGWVQPNVAAVSRVCTYDRAGMGWSDAVSEPRDARRIAADLHMLLERAHIPGPYLLVGHSFGGLLVRQYAAQYPAEVAGMVLVDAMHPDQYNRFPRELALPAASQFDVLLPLVSVGLSRVFTPFPTEPALPTPQRQQIAAFNASTKSMSAIAHEYQAFPAILAQVATAGDLGAIPLVVLTAENSFPQSAEGNRVWEGLQNELAALSSNSRHEHIIGTTHESLVYRERDAQATSAGILQAIAAVRTRLPLAP